MAEKKLNFIRHLALMTLYKYKYKYLCMYAKERIYSPNSVQFVSLSLALSHSDFAIVGNYNYLDPI